MIPHSSSFLDKSDFSHVSDITDRNYIGEGKICAELINHLKSISSRKYAILSNNGSEALELALYGLKVLFPGKSHVIVSSYTCTSVINAILKASLKPVFTDILRDSLNIDSSDAANKINGNILAIICSNIGGVPDDYGKIKQFRIPIISDCAQALGTIFNSKCLMSQGYCTALSFGSTKMITGGLGGALLCDNSEFYKIVKRYSLPELKVSEYISEGFFHTSGQHSSDLNSGVTLSQLKRLPDIIKRRRHISDIYDSSLSALKDISILKESPGLRFNRFRYYFLTHNSKSWLAFLQNNYIDARSSISHVIPCYFKSRNKFINLHKTASQVVSLPIYPGLKGIQLEYISSVINSFK